MQKFNTNGQSINVNFEREDISYDSTVLNMKVDNRHDYDNIENILYNKGPRIDMDF